jgi:hypothetical protein
MSENKIEFVEGIATRVKNTNPKTEEFYEQHKDLIHLKGEDGSLCKSKGAVKFTVNADECTCHSCGRRSKR